MRYIGLALYAEGRTDEYFLRPLLLRLCIDICLNEGLEPVDFSEVEALTHPADHSDDSRSDRIVAAAMQHMGAWQILFIHGDGDGDPVGSRSERVQPGINAVRAAFGQQQVAVGVVPVRETESWALRDGDAMRSVFGTTLTDARLGLPATARAVESVTDPKAALEFAFNETKPSGIRQRRGTAPHLNSLGEQVNLDRLKELPSFSVLVEELRDTLRALRVIR